MKRAWVPFLLVLAGCNNVGSSPNPIDVAMAPLFTKGSITPAQAGDSELCRRLSGDLLGHFLSADEITAQCAGKSVDAMVSGFQSTPEYLTVSRRNWRDRFATSDVLVDWRYLQDLYTEVDKLHSGQIGYSAFAQEAMAHPGFVMNTFQPEDKVAAVFSAFLGRPPTVSEKADLAALYRPWLPVGVPDPDFPEITLHIQTRIFPGLCGPLSQCTATMFGGGSLDLSGFSDPTFSGLPWESLTDQQKVALQEPGRILTSQDFFWEAAADEILNRYLSWSDGGRFPRLVGTVLPQVREVVANYLKATDSYPGAEKLVLSSWLYRMESQVPDDGLGDDPAAPVPLIYSTGPVKPLQAEVWLDSIKGLTLDLGACDERYSDGFPYFQIIQAQAQGKISASQELTDLKKLWTMEASRLPWDNAKQMPDFTYTFVARLIGGCPGYQSTRQPQTGLSFAFTQESLGELLCDASVAKGLVPQTGDPTQLKNILDWQMRQVYGRSPTAVESSDYSFAAASCSGADCTPSGLQ